MAYEAFLDRDALAREAEPLGRLETQAALSPPRPLHRPGPRNFQLPRAVFAAMALMIAGYVGVMAGVFSPGAGMGLVMAICFVCVAGCFGVPAIMARVRTDDRRGAMSGADFATQGLETATGRLGMGAALAQVLIMPVLLLIWALVIAAIHHAVL